MAAFILSREPWGQRTWGSVAWASVGVVPASGVQATATLGYSPEGIGPGTAPLVVTATLSGSVHQVIAGTFPLVVTVTLAGASGSMSTNLPSTQPGYQYVRSIPSTALPNNARQYVGVGVPSPSLGNNGDLYARADGVVGTDSLYKRSAGAWSAIN